MIAKVWLELKTTVQQSVPFKREAAFNIAQSSIRVQTNILASQERKLLEWLCGHMPANFTPDHLTALGLAGAATVFGGYVATWFHPVFLWLASLGLVVQWFGDSLDGNLARYRGAEKPRYGYFLDHSVDAFSCLLIMTGAGLSPYIRMDVALLALAGYYMLCMYQFLYNHVSHTFQLSFIALGPTEVRIMLMGINGWMYFAGDSKIQVGRETLTSYDFVVCGASIVLICLFVANVLATARTLRRESHRSSTGAIPCVASSKGQGGSHFRVSAEYSARAGVRTGR